MAKAPNTMVIVRNIFMKPLGQILRKRQRPSDHSQPLVIEDEEHEQHWLCANALSMAEVFKPPSAGRSWICPGPIVRKPLKGNCLVLLFWKLFGSIFHGRIKMIVPLLAGAAKTLVVSMLSERVVLRVLVMLSEWAAAKSTNSLDDRLVSEMKTKLEADGKL